MNNVLSLLKRTRLFRVIAVFAAGVLLLASTACSNPGSPKVSGEGSYTGNAPQTELYKQTQPREGGMNEFSNVDPRRNTNRSETKARSLVKNSERNIQKELDRPDQEDLNAAKRSINERSSNLVNEVRRSVEDLQEGTERGSRNLSRNARQAADEASDIVQDRTQETVRNSQRALENAQEGAKQAADSVRGRA